VEVIVPTVHRVVLLVQIACMVDGYGVKPIVHVEPFIIVQLVQNNPLVDGVEVMKIFQPILLALEEPVQALFLALALIGTGRPTNVLLQIHAALIPVALRAV